jgi:hypothetical protein
MIGQPKRFQKTVEDFVCEHCGHPVAGNGYTNHCSQCLWSKHVDDNSGICVESSFYKILVGNLSIEMVSLKYSCNVRI